MDTLPNEVLSLIFADSSKADLASARCTCRKICHSTEGLLFSDIFVYGNIESFRGLHELSQHPRLRQHVKRLLYSGLSLGGNHDADVLHHRNPTGDGQWQIRKTLQGEKSEEDFHYDQYCQHLEGQLLMQTGDADVLELKRCIQRFPNLRELEFYSGHQRYCKSKDNITRSTDFAPKSWDFVGRIARQTLVYPDPNSGRKYHSKQFKALVASAHVNPNILAIGGFLLPFDVLMLGWDLEICKNIRQIRHLELGIALPIHGSQLPPSHRFLAGMLAYAHQLETLELAYDGLIRGFEDVRVLNLDYLISIHAYWSHLTSLKLSNFFDLKTRFRDVLSTHAATLQILEIRNFKLVVDHSDHVSSTRDLWISLFQHIRTHLKLKQVRLGGQLGGFNGVGWTVEDLHEACTTCLENGTPLEGTLKHQIEQYLAHGDSFPGGFPESELADGELKDCSWRSRYSSKSYHSSVHQPVFHPDDRLLEYPA